MNEHDADLVIELLYEADMMPHGDTAVRMIEEAVQRAAELRDSDLLFYAKLKLAQQSLLGGFPEKALVAFTWCLSEFKTDPQAYESYLHTLLWEFKNLLHSITLFPQISLEQINDMLGQMAEMYRRYDYSPRPIHYLQCVTGIRTGDPPRAEKYFARWQDDPRDEMADCEACECDTRVEYYVFTDQHEQAIEQARPILRGRQTCAEVPHRTLALLLYSYIRLDRREEAQKCHRRGYRILKSNRVFLKQVADHLAYQARFGELAKAAAMLERHLDWALETSDLEARYRFYLAAADAVKRLDGPHTLRLPSEFPLFREDARYEPASLAAWFEDEARNLETAFNNRNGNDRYTRQVIKSLTYA